ncbi:N-acetylmuramoyl-L-alanine amidase [Fusibacter bizertensis]
MNKKFPIVTRLRRMIVFMLCIALLFPTQLSFANKYTEYESVELRESGSNVFKAYEPVNLMISGIDVFSDAPGITINGRTVVPVSAILVELGVKYQWNGSTKEISFSYGGKDVVMQINNVYATINGKKTLLPDSVAPRIMTYKSITGDLVDRTYVPLKFISDVLGLSASWINDTRTVAINKVAQTLTGTYIDVYKTYPEIRFKVTGEVDVTSFVVDGADVGGQDKTIIDFQNTKLTPPSGASVKNGVWTYNITDDIFGIDKIEISQTSDNPFNTRVTIYQNERRGNDIFYDAAKKEMVVQLINTVNEVSVDKIYSTDTVVIDTRETPFYNIDVSGKQLTVDIINSYLKINDGAYQVLPVSQGKIEAISYQQLDTSKSDMYDPSMEVTRVNIQLKEKMTYDDFYVEDSGDKLLVYITNQPINNFNYVKQSSEKGMMSIDLFGKTDFTSTYDAQTRKIMLDIPKDKTDLGSFEQAINDHIVDQFVVSETSSSYHIEITLAENTSYSKSSSSTSVVFNFTNAVIQNSDNKKTLIVIDAGHGGKDPGAVGSKAQEKDLTLRASKLLQSELEKQGFRVYMTRTVDEYVGLYDRPAIANDLGATLFVSIHINAFTNGTASGVEVLYGNESMSSDKGLAQNIQTQLIKSLGAVDRGIGYLPRLVVLKETTMPSVLCELGFITNAAEQDKLMSESYLKKAAEAIATGIVNFLK